MTDLTDDYQLFELEQTACAIRSTLERARIAREMHWTADHARHLATARQLTRNLSDALGTD